ncbi:MAG TPA: hypothetical protein VNM50_04720 [Chloroflexota bacterium]|nr:hypothetical protein [Chloroflexota bacterium]
MAVQRRASRARILAHFGAGPQEIAELLAYNENPFDHGRLPYPIHLPLPPEPHVAAWEGYAAEAAERGVFATLARRLPQLRFPIREGISQTEAYRAVTRRGRSPDEFAEATGLSLQAPDALRLVVHQSATGPIPVLVTGPRADFVTLVQALSKRNEPWPVPLSMGASLVQGFNNWDRIRAYRRRWEAEDPAHRDDAAWAWEFERLVPRRELYEDRFIILSSGPYSNVAAAELGLPEETWQQLSLRIRIEHECVHYFTARMFGVARNNVFDEVLADYLGIVAAAGHYRRDWALRFLGLEAFPVYREGGRLQNYRGDPPLSDAAFVVLQALTRAAIDHLARYDAARFPRATSPAERGPTLLALTRLTLEEMASPEFPALVDAGLR